MPAAPYFQTDFPAAEFQARRGRVLEHIGKNAVAVLPGAPATGAFDRFRQYNEFYYLCGVEVPHAYLLLDGRSGRTTLYLPRHDPKHERSEGAQLHCDDVETVCRLTAVSAVRPPEALAADLAGASTIYSPGSPLEGAQACRDVLRYAYKLAESDPWNTRVQPEAVFRDRLAQIAPHAEFRNLSEVVDSLREVKSSLELDLMRRAGRLTALAVREAITATRPGLMEYELAAIGDYVYLAGGARGMGYRPIVACGANIWNAHYFRNNCPLVEGELVLMDYAPDVGCYTSDIGRMWPVNGRYSPVQRELYGFIVRYHQVMLTKIRPGVTAAQVMDEAAREMRPVAERTRWSKPAFAAAAAKTLEYTGHCSHGVGMAVHDVGDYTREPLRPGVVFALDPQLWVPEEQLYIRVEDTVAVTETGVEVLTAGVPLELNEVEALVGAAATRWTVPS